MRGDVLIVEDDQAIANQIAAYVQRAGFTPRVAETGIRGLSLYREHRPVCIVLDCMLPEMDGLRLCEQIREDSSDVPILFVTARIDEQERLEGFATGADDYITKPFSLRELIARIEVAMKRTHRMTSAISLRDVHGGDTLELRYGPMFLSGREKLLYWRDRPLVLTASELRLMRTMVTFPERVFTRDELLAELYPFAEADVVDRAIDVHIANLRRKLREREEGADECLQTVRGFGYRLSCAEACSQSSS